MDLFIVACLASLSAAPLLGDARSVAEPSRRAENGLTDERKPRKLFPRIQNGIAFLAGVKVGSLLSNKAFEAGHGSLAASNSFHVFGKSVNSAISLSYGGHRDVPQVLGDEAANATDLVRVTLVRSPPADAATLRGDADAEFARRHNKLVNELNGEIRRRNGGL